MIILFDQLIRNKLVHQNKYNAAKKTHFSQLEIIGMVAMPLLNLSFPGNLAFANNKIRILNMKNCTVQRDLSIIILPET